MINEDDAARHPRYEEFKKKFWSFPTIYGHEYVVGCFMRWVAMAVLGGGIMVDYDVMNYGFKPQEFQSEKLTIISDTEIPVTYLGVVQGPAHLFDAMSEVFFAWEPDKRDWKAEANALHCDDNSFVVQFLNSHTRECPPWLAVKDGCTRFPKITGQLVHYGYEMRAAGYWPKCDFVEQVRPF
jgi:hypothetical protein